MTRRRYFTTKNTVSQNDKRLIYGIGGLILFVFAFVFIIAPYQPPTKEDGENYLERNKLKRRVKTLPSGLQYKVLSRFSYVDDSFLRKPLPSSKIRVKYEGRLVDGVVFDKKDDAVFEMKKVIKGKRGTRIGPVTYDVFDIRRVNYSYVDCMAKKRYPALYAPFLNNKAAPF